MNRKQIVGYNIFVNGLLEDQDEITAKDLNYWIFVWNSTHIDLVNSEEELDEIAQTYANENVKLNARLVALKEARTEERLSID